MTNAVISIELNGAPHQVPPRQTLDQLVEALSLGGQALALAVNRSVVPRFGPGISTGVVSRAP